MAIGLQPISYLLVQQASYHQRHDVPLARCGFDVEPLRAERPLPDQAVIA